MSRLNWSVVKLRVELAEAFHYPDVFVTCDPRESQPFVQRCPRLVIEVRSPATEAVSRRE